MPDPIDELKSRASVTANELGRKIRHFRREVRKQARATSLSAESYFAGGKAVPGALGAAVKDSIRQHPIPSLGVASALGFFSTYWFEKTWAPALRRASKEFEPELRELRRVALSVVTKATSNHLSSALQILSGEVAQALADEAEKYDQTAAKEPTPFRPKGHPYRGGGTFRPNPSGGGAPGP